MDSDTPIYSSRIIKNYLDFIGKFYPEFDVDALLSYANISRYEIQDPAHWLTQRQIDRFHDHLTLELGDPDIPHKAGRYFASAEGLGSLKKYALGLVNPTGAYKLLGRMYTILSRAATVESTSKGPNAIEIVVTPKTGIDERPFQCDNRLGTFESLAELFTGKPATIEHPACYHKGDPHCHYIIKWERMPSAFWRRIRNFCFIISVPAVILLNFALPGFGWAMPVLIVFGLVGALSGYAEWREKSELKRALAMEGDTAKAHLDELSRRYNTALLIQEIGQTAASIMDRDNLIRKVMAAMEVRLEFDRGMIMLANREKSRLHYVAGYGYTAEYESQLRKAAFHLNRPESRGIFVQTFRRQKPSLVDDISEIEADLSEKSKEFAHQSGARSLICVPIVYENESLGILAIDNLRSGSPLTQSDVSLLTGVASQTAASIVNAVAFRKLVESESRFRGAFDHAAIGRTLASASGRFQRVNASMCAITGYSEKEFLSLSWKDVSHPDELKLIQRTIRELLDGAAPSRKLEMKIIHKQGGPVWVRVNLVVIRDSRNTPLYLSGDFEDISQRKRFESALEESEGKYRNILQSIEEGYFEVDLSGHLTFLNDALTRISGFTQPEIEGKSFRAYTSLRIAENLTQQFNEVFETGRSIDFTEYETTRADGEKRYLELSASLMRNESGQPSGFRGIVRDVTARKSSEEEKRRLEAQIQHSQKMEAIGTLAGGVAHDFNNLLMGIQGNVSLMMMDIENTHPHHKGMGNILGYVERCAMLTKQLLGFARGGKYEVSTLNLSELVTGNAEMFGRTKKEITIFEDYQEDLWTVDADRGQIEQVLLNLLVNAGQAMPGGGSLFLETRNVELNEKFVRPYGFEPGRYVRLAITDTGIGMDPETRQRIFEPFFTTKKRGEGTGLGLASAYGIIKNHSGIIDVISQRSKGTTFRIYIPAGGKVIETERGVEEELRKGAGTVLFIDDEDMILQVGSQMLNALGYTVLTSASGSQGVEILRDQKTQVDLVILDMVMPDMGGKETFDALRQIDPDIKVLLSSGYSAEGPANEIMKKGCNGFIQKPFNISELSSKISSVLKEAATTN